MKKILFAFTLSLATLTTLAQPHYRIYAVRFASMLKRLPLSYWVQKAPEKDSVNIDFMVWLIKGDNGKTILLDAGFQRGLDDQKEFEPFTYTRPDSALEKLNIHPADITDIIISHPHWDHIDGLNLFPNAHAWMQKEDYGYYVGGAWQKGGQPGGFAKRDVRMLLDYNLAGRLTLVDGDDKEIIPGITVYTGSRHTFNSQFVVVNTGVDPAAGSTAAQQGSATTQQVTPKSKQATPTTAQITPAANKVLLASDNLWVYYSLDHMMPPSEGGTFDNAAFVRSLQRMKTLVADPKYIVPGHDAAIFTRFPKVAEGVVEIR
ncbi:MAG TPA: N-acyl homoserine lactonase family protein [Puia sp.]|uniref:N-acyl homoserine lactonase family protein n=1 Tax=Puia sp. TaxID=2045100 RepID=UPI002C8B43FD|nr:N-acyl homoserine lactonase family protein [Puia sp.]HVU98488.1 N-acyl homoserine lactonase family protein [Puia sp.]